MYVFIYICMYLYIYIVQYGHILHMYFVHGRRNMKMSNIELKNRTSIQLYL